jgi:lysophospholipase L1-like esterase
MITLLGTTLAMSQVAIATTPTDRLLEGWWKQRHEACLKVESCDVAFLGDSITQGWEVEGRAIWDKLFAPLKAANFGFGGDRTEHVLWRLANGELIPAKPKLVVIMIGTNNIGHRSTNAEATAEGVRAIVGQLRKGLPKSRILLLGILPRGRTADDEMRRSVAQATEGFKTGADGKYVHFFDSGRPFLRADGLLRDTLMPDLLHLNSDGYEVWARAIEPEIRRLLAP